MVLGAHGIETKRCRSPGVASSKPISYGCLFDDQLAPPPPNKKDKTVAPFYAVVPGFTYEPMKTSHELLH